MDQLCSDKLGFELSNCSIFRILEMLPMLTSPRHHKALLAPKKKNKPLDFINLTEPLQQIDPLQQANLHHLPTISLYPHNDKRISKRCRGTSRPNKYNQNLAKHSKQNENLIKQKNLQFRSRKPSPHSKIEQLSRRCKKVLQEKNFFCLKNLSMPEEKSQEIEPTAVSIACLPECEEAGGDSTVCWKQSTFKIIFDPLEQNKEYLQNISKQLIPFQESWLVMTKMSTQAKPPQRYKIAMAILTNCLILYGGLGCQKNISWAKLHFKTMKWEKNMSDFGKKNKIIHQPSLIQCLERPKQAEDKKVECEPLIPIYGHSMVRYREQAVVFGGRNVTQTNETTIINVKTMKTKQACRGPNSRRDHVAVIHGHYMIIHGGVQASETLRSFMAYNVRQDKWHTCCCPDAPALSCHGFASTDSNSIFRKNKKNQCFYIFGGKNEHGKSMGSLYRVWMVLPKEIKCQKVESINPPKARFSFCFQGLSDDKILLYGGKQSEEETDISHNMCKGVFNDIHLYNTETKVWTLISQAGISMQYCFGMASASMTGRVFIFGGCTLDNYCDATVLTFCLRGNEAEGVSARSKKQELHHYKSSYKLLM